MSTDTIILITILVVAFFMLISMIFVVKQKTVVIIELFGRFQSAKHAGLNIKLPAPFAKIAGTVNMKVQEIRAQVEVKTSDNAFISFPVSVQFRVIEDKAKEAFYELQDPVEQITSYVLNLVRSKAAIMDMNELYTSRDDINKEVETSLKADLAEYGYEIVRVLVDQPEPSEEVADAFNRVIAARRENEAAVAEANALKTKLVGQAEAESESLKLKAIAYVQQRKTLAEGIGEAMDKLREGLKGVNDKQIMDYFAGIDYRDTIREASKGAGSVIIVPANSYMAEDAVMNAAVVEAIQHNKK